MNYIEERVISIAHYIIDTGATVRQAARVFNVSKSTVHKDMTYRLKHIKPALVYDVRRIIDKNKAERHIRGGMATREKYQHLNDEV